MHPEAAFLAGYALALVAVAAGLDLLGRRSAHPWSSKVLAASRPPGAQLDGDPDWPHAEVPVFHLGLSGVALTAALLLAAASVARHHRPIELVVQLAVLALIAARITTSARAQRQRRRRRT